MEDQAVRQLLEQFSTETRRHFDVVAGELRSELSETRQDLRKEIAETRQHTESVAVDLRRELSKEISEARQHTDVVAADLRKEIMESRQHAESLAAETRRHFDVVAEGFRKEVQLVAEGVATLNDQVVRLRSDMTGELTEVKSMIRLSYSELDRRLRTLEATVLHLDERVNRLETERSH